jgi:hypothetical protein
MHKVASGRHHTCETIFTTPSQQKALPASSWVSSKSPFTFASSASGGAFSRQRHPYAFRRSIELKYASWHFNLALRERKKGAGAGKEVKPATYARRRFSSAICSTSPILKSSFFFWISNSSYTRAHAGAYTRIFTGMWEDGCTYACTHVCGNLREHDCCAARTR